RGRQERRLVDGARRGARRRLLAAPAGRPHAGRALARLRRSTVRQGGPRRSQGGRPGGPLRYSFLPLVRAARVVSPAHGSAPRGPKRRRLRTRHGLCRSLASGCGSIPLPMQGEMPVARLPRIAALALPAVVAGALALPAPAADYGAPPKQVQVVRAKAVLYL